VEAARNGDWVLLDEINLASAETLGCLCAILDSDTLDLQDEMYMVIVCLLQIDNFVISAVKQL
jgi:hypothetical protein